MAELSHAAQMVIVLAAMAGAVHVMAPDHWLPASVVSWQRGWGLRRSALFSLLTLLIHIALGLAIYFCFESALARLQAARLFGFTLVLIFGVMLVRLVRFSRIREVFATGPRGAWALFSIVMMIGPCESVIPILIKSRQLGIGYLIPIVAFAAGTCVAGTSFVLAGRLFWNRPLALPWGMRLSYRGAALLPVVAGLAVGLSAILRLS